VWLVAASLCAVLLGRDAASPRAVGLARGRVVQLSVAWPARVEAVPVKLFQKVERDQVVAIVDHSVVSAQIEQVEAEIARLRAEHTENQDLLDADVGARRSDWSAESRAFARDASELAIRLHEVRVELEYDRAMAEGLQAHVASLEPLVVAGHAAPAELDLARAEAAATKSRALENERLAADLEERLAQAESRRDQHMGHEPVRPPRAPAMDHLTHAIGVQVGLLRELQAQRAQSILKAPFDGTVVTLLGRAGEAALRRPGEGDVRFAGEVVAAGDPVIAIAADRPTEIVGYVVGRTGGRLREGREVRLVNPAGKAQIGVSKIESISPTVERLPESLWGASGIASWGRPFLVPVPEGFDVTAGDRVHVHFR
jgi:multidrug efflux pump subunit AcrA (membrane-fusion protein)